MSDQQPILEIRNLTMHFGMIAAAEDENLSVQEGERIGIIGPNGAGKTTFLNLVTGYLRPQRGSIRIAGHEIVGRSPHDIARLGVGRSFQRPQLFDTLPVRDNVLLGLALASGRGRDGWRPLATPAATTEATLLLDRFGLGEIADRRADELPEGARKLLDVVLAFTLRPRLVLLDEPTSGVSATEKDPLMATIMGAVEERRETVLFIEHDMDVVRRFAQRVVVLANGRFVADGPPATVLDDPEIRRTVAGWS